MDFEAFRVMFPVFGDDKKYPDDFLEMWADASSLHLRKGWSLSGKTYDYALNLMMAHLIYTSGKAAENNGSGMVSSASEGSVSVSFATPTTKNGWEFWLASSPYGLQFAEFPKWLRRPDRCCWRWRYAKPTGLPRRQECLGRR